MVCWTSPPGHNLPRLTISALAPCIIYQLALWLTSRSRRAPPWRAVGGARTTTRCSHKSRSLSSVLSLIQCTHYTCTVCSNYTELPAIVMPHNEAHVARRVGSHWTGRLVSACHWLGVVTVQQPSTALTPLALSLYALSL